MSSDSDRELSTEEKAFIAEAAQALDRGPWIMRASDWIGRPFEKALEHLPSGAKHAVSIATQKALEVAVSTALKTMGQAPSVTLDPEWKDRVLQVSRVRFKHGAAATVTGALGGFAGLPALAVELPVTTTLLLRSMLRVAEEMGLDPRDPWIQMDCLMLFAMGSPTNSSDDALNSSYYATRMALASLVAESAKFIASRSQAEILKLLSEGGAPALIGLVAQVGTRFQGVVTQKFVAQVLPIAGAALAGTINALFLAHFTSVARYHFGLKKLEKEYGADKVRALYQAQTLAGTPRSS